MFDNLSTLPASKIKRSSTETNSSLAAQQSQVAQNQQVNSRVEKANNDSQMGNENLDERSSGEQVQVADRKSLLETVDNLNDRLESQELQARFSLDDESGQFVVKIVNANSGKVVRQIPSEQTLEFAHNAEKGVGVLVNKSF